MSFFHRALLRHFSRRACPRNMPNGLFLSCTQLNVQHRIVKHAREFQASLEVTQDHHTAHDDLML